MLTDVNLYYSYHLSLEKKCHKSAPTHKYINEKDNPNTT